MLFMRQCSAAEREQSLDYKYPTVIIVYNVTLTGACKGVLHMLQLQGWGVSHTRKEFSGYYLPPSPCTYRLTNQMLALNMLFQLLG